MRRLITIGLLSLCVLAGCKGGVNPKLCVDTTALPALPGTAPAPDPNAPTERCGGFVLGVSVGERDEKH